MCFAFVESSSTDLLVLLEPRNLRYCGQHSQDSFTSTRSLFSLWASCSSCPNSPACIPYQIPDQLTSLHVNGTSLLSRKPDSILVQPGVIHTSIRARKHTTSSVLRRLLCRAHLFFTVLCSQISQCTCLPGCKYDHDAAHPSDNVERIRALAL